MKKQVLFISAFIMLAVALNAQQVIENFEGSGSKSVMNAISGGITSIAANPSKTGINMSDSVGKLEINNATDPWVGFWVNRRTDNSPDDSATSWINANDNHYVHVMVYKSFVSNLKFKLEASWSGTVEIYGTTPDSGKNSKMNEWEDIVIDFMDTVKGYVPVWLLSPAWDRPSGTETAVVYFDNIVINNDPDPITATSVKSVNSSRFDLWPNPVTDKIHIRSATTINNIVVSNMLGEQVLKIKATGNEYTLSAGTLSSGVYFVSVTNNVGNITSSRIIKK